MSPHAKPPPAPEREPLSPDEAAVLLQARAALGADFARLPRDVLVQFVRGYRAEPDWPAATVRHLRELVAWRDRERCDEILLPAHAPEQRAEFERMWRTSVIGEDGEGHPVVLEPLGKIPPAEFAALFPEALFLRHCVYTKEALRRLCVHASARRSLRVYKCVVVLDLAGLSLRHTGGRFISMVAAYISAFGNAYPECLQKLYIVNAPLIFAGVWAVVRPLLHPLTAKKVGLFYGRANAAKAMAADGISLSVALEEAQRSAPSCSQLVAERQLAAPELRPFVPPAELPFYEADYEEAAALVAAALDAQAQAAAAAAAASSAAAAAKPASAAAHAPAGGALVPLGSAGRRAAPGRVDVCALGAAGEGGRLLQLKAPHAAVTSGGGATTGTLELEGPRVVYFALLSGWRLVWYATEGSLNAHLLARSADGADGAPPSPEAAPGLLGAMVVRRVHGGARHLLLCAEDGSALCARRSTGAAQIEIAVAQALGRRSPCIGAGQWLDLADGSSGPKRALQAAGGRAEEGRLVASRAGVGSAPGGCDGGEKGALCAPAAPAALAAEKAHAAHAAHAEAPVRAGAESGVPPMLLVLAAVASLLAANVAVLGQWRLELTWN